MSPANASGAKSIVNLATPVVFFSCAVFSLLLAGLAIYWRSAGVFEYDNSLFDMDAHGRLKSLMEGWSTTSMNHIIHPLFAIFTHGATLILSAFLLPLSWFGLLDDPIRLAAILLLPVASGFAAYLIFDLFRVLEFDRPTAYGLMIVYCLSFSTIISGSLPEHYIFDNIGLLVLLRMSVRSFQTGLAIPTKSIIVAGIAMVGVTITNIIPLAIVYILHSVGLAIFTIGTAVRRTLMVITACIAIAAPVYWAASDDSGSTAMKTAEWVTTYQVPSYSPARLIKRAGAFVIGFADGFIASPVTLYRKSDPQNVEPPQLRATLHAVPSSPWPYAKGLLMGAAILFGFLGWRRAKFDLMSPVGACLAIIGFYWALLVLWGTEMFLYSQFWIAPGLVLLAGLGKILQPQSFKAVLAGVALTQLVVNGYELRRLLIAFG